MIRDANGNNAGTSDLVSIMVKVREKAEIDIITILVNQIIVGVIPESCGLGIFVN